MYKKSNTHDMDGSCWWDRTSLFGSFGSRNHPPHVAYWTEDVCQKFSPILAAYMIRRHINTQGVWGTCTTPIPSYKRGFCYSIAAEIIVTPVGKSLSSFVLQADIIFASKGEPKITKLVCKVESIVAG